MYGYFDQADKANGHNIYRAPDGRMVEVTEISDVLLDRPNAVIVDLSDHSLVHMLGPVMYRGEIPPRAWVPLDPRPGWELSIGARYVRTHD